MSNLTGKSYHELMITKAILTQLHKDMGEKFTAYDDGRWADAYNYIDEEIYKFGEELIARERGRNR